MSKPATDQAVPRPVALITGAAQEIGLLTAKRLAATHRVALLDLQAEKLPQAAAECGEDAIHVACDITQQNQVEAAVAAVVSQAGGIDVIISNAGIAVGGSLRLTDPDVLAAQMNVNLTGNWRIIHACLPHVIERRGYVLGVASAAAIAPTPSLGAYCASKAALEMLLDVLYLEVAPLGVERRGRLLHLHRHRHGPTGGPVLPRFRVYAQEPALASEQAVSCRGCSRRHRGRGARAQAQGLLPRVGLLAVEIPDASSYQSGFPHESEADPPSG